MNPLTIPMFGRVWTFSFALMAMATLNHCWQHPTPSPSPTPTPAPSPAPAPAPAPNPLPPSPVSKPVTIGSLDLGSVLKRIRPLRYVNPYKWAQASDQFAPYYDNSSFDVIVPIPPADQGDFGPKVPQPGGGMAPPTATKISEPNAGAKIATNGQERIQIRLTFENWSSLPGASVLVTVGDQSRTMAAPAAELVLTVPTSQNLAFSVTVMTTESVSGQIRPLAIGLPGFLPVQFVPRL